MFMLPGLEGCAAGLEPLCRRLKTKACVLQLGYAFKNESSEQMVNRLYEVILHDFTHSLPMVVLGISLGFALTRFA